MKRQGELGHTSSPKPPAAIIDDTEKRRKVTFEPVRLPAVSHLNDLRYHEVVYKYSKLRSLILTKNKRIAELEREYERSKRRQQTDESNFAKVFNMFCEVEKFILGQTKEEFGDVVMTPAAPAGTDVLGMTADAYQTFVETAKANLKAAFTSYAKARHDRHKEAIAFLNKLKDPKTSASEASKELASKAAEALSQLDKLQIELHKVQGDCYNADRKRRQMADKSALLESRIQEVEKLLEDARFEADKQMRLASKFEARLALDHDARASTSSVVTANQTEKKTSVAAPPPSEATIREIDMIRIELDEQKALANRRLHELEDSSKKYQSLTQELGKMKMELQMKLSFSSEDIFNSEEYKTLKKFYSLSCKEYDRLCKELDECAGEREQFRSAKENREKTMSEEHQKTMKEIQQQADAHLSFYKISHDSEILRAEFETVKEEYNKIVKQSEWDEMKATLNTLRALNKTIKAQLNRARKREEISLKEVEKLNKELGQLKDLHGKSILVPTVEGVVHGGSSDINGLRQENEALRRQVVNLGSDKQKQVDVEVERRIGEKMKEMETIKTANETLTQDEQYLSDELDSICLTIEEEQERVSQLICEKREQEDRNLKMLNERMIQNQVQQRLTDKVDMLESKSHTDAQIAKMNEFEKKASDETISKLQETLQFKSSELTRLGSLMDVNRKQIMELGMAKEETQVKFDRSEAQLKSIQDLYSTKSREVEEIKFKRQRIEEELELYRGKYERTKRNDPAQSGDQVLEEANRQMKETLTCPSCKIRPKDCIMLKCYHLFCEHCIKTMYDTRQRKCPKCASNFGANDFHRIFI